MMQPQPTPTQLAAHLAHIARRRRIRERAVHDDGIDLWRRKMVKPVDVVEPVESQAVAKTAPIPEPEPEPPPAPPAILDCQRPSIDVIQRVVAHEYQIPLLEMKSQRRHLLVIVPRHVAMWLATKLTLRSSTEIGKVFGGRDHTTVLHARDKVERMVATDADLRARISAILKVLSELGYAVPDDAGLPI